MQEVFVMYSLVLMMALGNGATAPGIDIYQPKEVASLASHGHTLNRRGCYGCSGCWGCHGCRGCYGCGGCHGCWGCWGCYGGCHGCWGCYGGWCYGCGGCYGGYAYGGYASIGYATNYGSALVAMPTTATIVVSLPADAKLSVEDQPT